MSFVVGARIHHGSLRPGAASGNHVVQRWEGLRSAREALVSADYGGIWYETDTKLFYILGAGGWSQLGGFEADVGVAAVALGGHRLVCRTEGSTLAYASADDVFSALALLGLTTGASAAGATVAVVESGVVTEPSWSWTPREPVLLGLNGIPVQTLPAGASVCLRVGIALSETSFMVRFGHPILL
ncbi:MAG: hypothetical protein RLZZ450_72 [Pseudomonadota bacterium]|jgi:hypothetical protein